MPSDSMGLWGHMPEVWQAPGRLTSGLGARQSSQGWCHPGHFAISLSLKEEEEDGLGQELVTAE